MNIKDWTDAKTKFKFFVTPRATLHCKKKDPFNCVQARAIRCVDGVDDVKVFKEFTFIKFVGHALPTKYLNSPDVKRLASINDLEGRRSVLDELRAEFEMWGRSLPFNLLPIKDGSVRSKEYLRSEEMKQKRKESAERRKGKPKRKYTKPSGIGLRSGIGLAHSWNHP